MDGREQLIGRLKWSAIEVATSSQTFGEVEVHLESVSTSRNWMLIRRWYQKSIRLDDDFSISYCEHPGKWTSGFGLTAGRTNEQLFCWEWFIVTGPDSAVKLQEAGEIHFVKAKTACGHEITYMKFKTDVSMRLMVPGRVQKYEPRWRVTLLKGSEIYWPSLIRGKLNANGFI